MAYISLAIIEPQNNSSVVGGQSVEFVGKALEIPDEALGSVLYYRWYSSLFSPTWSDPDHPDYFSVERNVLTRADTVFEWTPGIGSHVITFAVSDQNGETREQLEAITHSGVTGGSEEGDSQCLLHVFSAVPLPPQGNINALPKTDFRLIAQAPTNWGSLVPDSDPIEYTANVDYHKYNRLQYRWEIIPEDTSATLPSLPDPLTPENLAFGRYSQFNTDIEPIIDDEPNPDDVFVVCYPSNRSESLNIANGTYTILLHVEDNHPDSIGHSENSFVVTITD